MKDKFMFKQLPIVFTVALFFLIFATSSSFTSYAADGDFNDHWLSQDGGVKANYNAATKVLTINGAGTVDYDKWVAMAQKIDANYFGVKKSWDEKISEDMMQIVFIGQPKAIKLCGTENPGHGLFRDFAGKISFNGAVDLAPTATDTSYMFAYARQFNEPVDFNTSNVENMHAMFLWATAFKQPIFFDIGSTDNIEWAFYSSGAEQIILRNSKQKQNIKAHNAFSNCANLYYLSFEGLEANLFDGLSEDYYVQESYHNPIAMNANQPYTFSDNKRSRFYFQSAATAYEDFKLSADGGVMAKYDTTSKVLTIYGAGVVKYDGWVEMARLINPTYFSLHNSWSYQFEEWGMKIQFMGSPKAIKLCGTEKIRNGLFADFSGSISFNGAVDLAPGVTDISTMFEDAVSFNEPVDFNTSSVTTMSYMFAGAESFNQPINFDTRNVTDMSHMFSFAKSFNQPVNCDTSKVTKMSYMFSSANNFNQPLNFDTSNAKDMWSMLGGATSFNQPVNFDISSAENIGYMFTQTAVEYVTLTNGTNNQNIGATELFRNLTSLKYLEFSGLINAKIDGFSGDYYVKENGGPEIAMNASDGYVFNNNQSYRVYLQAIEKPKVKAYKSVNKIIVKWTPVSGASGYEVYSAYYENGPFTLITNTNELSQVYYFGYLNFKKQQVGSPPCYYKVRAYRTYGDFSVTGPFSDVAKCEPLFQHQGNSPLIPGN